jgi:hypothetical protein
MASSSPEPAIPRDQSLYDLAVAGRLLRELTQRSAGGYVCVRRSRHLWKITVRVRRHPTDGTGIHWARYRELCGGREDLALALELALTKLLQAQATERNRLAQEATA